MQLTLNQQVAITLRQRPLVLPMLLATACVDLVACLQCLRQEDVLAFWYWGLLTPQFGLLSIWVAHSRSCLGRRVACLCFYLAFLSATFSATSRSHLLGGLVSLLLAYAGLIGMGSIVPRLVRWRTQHADASVSDAQPRFSMWQLMMAMTAVSMGAAIAPHLEWDVGSQELPIFGGMIGIVLLAYYGSFLRPSPWMGWGLTILPALSLEGAYWNGPDIIGVFLGHAVTSGVWLFAVKMSPDARRRLAARRERRAPRLTVVRPPEESAGVLEPRVEPTLQSLDLDA